MIRIPLTTVIASILLTTFLFVRADKKASIEVQTMHDFNKVINSTQPTIIKFYASWCGACTAMASDFDQVAHTYKGKIQFVNIDVDKEALKDVVDMFGIQGTPTLVYKELGKKNKQELIKRIEAFFPEASKKPSPKLQAKKHTSKKLSTSSKASKKQMKKPVTLKVGSTNMTIKPKNRKP